MDDTIIADFDGVQAEIPASMAGNPDFIKTVRANLVNAGHLPPSTVAGKALKMVKDVASYPMGLPANPERIAKPIVNRDVAGSYYELMPRMEKGAADVKSASSASIGNILSSGKLGSIQEKYPQTVGAIGATADLALNMVPFEPSSFAMPALPIVAGGSKVISNFPKSGGGETPIQIEGAMQSVFNKFPKSIMNRFLNSHNGISLSRLRKGQPTVGEEFLNNKTFNPDGFAQMPTSDKKQVYDIANKEISKLGEQVDSEINRLFEKGRTPNVPETKVNGTPQLEYKPTETFSPTGNKPFPFPQVDMVDTSFSDKLPIAGKIVDGREVNGNIPNMGSISSSLNNYDIVKGIREIPISEFNLTGKHYSVEGNNRISKLTEEIKTSKKITPLIVVADKEGYYILEGSTRADALKRLGAKSFPAKVVIDLDNPPLLKHSATYLPDTMATESQRAATGRFLGEGQNAGKFIPPDVTVPLEVSSGQKLNRDVVGNLKAGINKKGFPLTGMKKEPAIKTSEIADAVNPAIDEAMNVYGENSAIVNKLKELKSDFMSGKPEYLDFRTANKLRTQLGENIGRKFNKTTAELPEASYAQTLIFGKLRDKIGSISPKLNQLLEQQHILFDIKNSVEREAAKGFGELPNLRNPAGILSSPKVASFIHGLPRTRIPPLSNYPIVQGQQ